MIREHEKKWFMDSLMNLNHYVPVIWDGKVLREGIRRLEINQGIRLDHLDVKGKTVVDLGCNNGYFCFKLMEKGAIKCTGIDTDQQILRAADIIKRYNEHEGVRFYVSDLYIADAYQLKSDVALLLSLAPADFELQKLVDPDFNTHRAALRFLHRFGNTIYLEPTNHQKQTQKGWHTEIEKARVNVEALGGSLEFLTWTDYQKRPLIKIIPVVN